MSNNTKEKILEVAFQTFAAKGYEATSMNDIAALVGVTKPALYTYFKSKEDLVITIYEKVEKDYQAYMQKVIEETENFKATIDKLYYIFERYISYFQENLFTSAFWIRIIFFPPPTLKDHFSNKMYELENVVFSSMRGIFQDGIKSQVICDADEELLMMAFYCMREGILMASAQNMSKNQTRNIWKCLWNGIKGPQGPEI